MKHASTALHYHITNTTTTNNEQMRMRIALDIELEMLGLGFVESWDDKPQAQTFTLRTLFIVNGLSACALMWENREQKKGDRSKKNPSFANTYRIIFLDIQGFLLLNGVCLFTKTQHFDAPMLHVRCKLWVICIMQAFWFMKMKVVGENSESWV